MTWNYWGKNNSLIARAYILPARLNIHQKLCEICFNIKNELDIIYFLQIKEQSSPAYVERCRKHDQPQLGCKYNKLPDDYQNEHHRNLNISHIITCFGKYSHYER